MWYMCLRKTSRHVTSCYTSHPESIYSTTTAQTTDNRLSCVLMNSMWLNVEYCHNTHSTQYGCTHYTLLSTAWCFQSVCISVTPWCIILFSTNISPLVHPPANFPPNCTRAATPQGLSREMQTVLTYKPTWWSKPEKYHGHTNHHQNLRSYGIITNLWMDSNIMMAFSLSWTLNMRDLSTPNKISLLIFS
jgi:hypothetical protein